MRENTPERRERTRTTRGYGFLFPPAARAVPPPFFRAGPFTSPARLSAAGERLCAMYELLSTTYKQFSTMYELFSTTYERLNTMYEWLSTTSKKFSTTFKRLSTNDERLSTIRERFSATSKQLSTTCERISAASRGLSSGNSGGFPLFLSKKLSRNGPRFGKGA